MQMIFCLTARVALLQIKWLIFQMSVDADYNPMHWEDKKNKECLYRIRISISKYCTEFKKLKF